MEPGDSKVSFLLDGGIADRRAIELRGPTATQFASPLLARSDNTRLSITMGSPERAPGAELVVSGLPEECHGVIPAGNMESALVLFREPAENRVINGLSDPGLYDRASSRAGTVAIPARVVRGGGSPLPATSSFPASAYDPETGNVWHVQFGDISGATRFYVFVETVDGIAVTRPSDVGLAGGTYSRWCAITIHGQDAVVWCYRSTVGLIATRLRIDPSTNTVFTPSGPVTVYLPANNRPPDVQRFDATTALIWGGDVTTAADATLLKYAVTTGVITTGPTVTVGATSTYAVKYESVLGDNRIVTATAGSTGPALYVALYDSAMGIIWQVSRATAAGYTECAVGFYAMPDRPTMVVAIANDVIGTFSTSVSPPQTIQADLYGMSIATGANALVATTVIHAWKRLLNKGAQLKFSETELVPTFAFCTMFSDLAYNASFPDFVDDPAYEIYQFGMLSALQAHLAPIARVGVVRGTASPAHVHVSDLLTNGTAVALVGGDKFVFSYLAAESRPGAIGPTDWLRSNIVTIDFSPQHILTAGESRGGAITVGAMPFLWDGNELTEYGGPLSRPHAYRNTAIGGAVVFPAGDYFFCAYTRWRDASGDIVRSRPSNVIQFTANGATAPSVSVSASLAMTRRTSNVIGMMETVLCGTPVNQPDFHEIAVATFTNDTHIHFAPSVPLNSDPAIYSVGAAGQELTPHPPPPLRDVTIVGSRKWGIDAEFPFRAVYSKLRIGGIGHEFNPALEVLFPRIGGELVRVFEVSGVVVFLAERAVWQVVGTGPDNTGANGSYSPPIKVSDFGCTEPLSACAFPGGVAWASHGRWFILRGATVIEVPYVKANLDFRATVGMRDQDEIVFYGTQTSDDPGPAEVGDTLVYEHDFTPPDERSPLVDDSGAFLIYDTSSEATAIGVGAPIAKVYNYLLDRWSRWISPAVAAYTHAANSPNEFRRHITFHDGELRVIDGESYAAGCPVVFETDWLLLGGDPHDHIVVRDVILNGEQVTSHTVTIDVLTDYMLTPSTTRSWDATEILNIMSEQQSEPRYSLRLMPQATETRAVKVRVTITTEGTGAGGRALVLTLCYKVFSAIREQAFSRAVGGYK